MTWYLLHMCGRYLFSIYNVYVAKETEQYNIPPSQDRFTEARVLETNKQWSFLMDASKAFYFDKKDTSSNRKYRYLCPVCDEKKRICCEAELEPYEERGRFFFRTKRGQIHQHLFPEDYLNSISTTVVYSPSSFLSFLLDRKNRKADYQDKIVLYESQYDIPFPMPEVVQPSNLEEYYFQTRRISLDSMTPVGAEGIGGNYKFGECLVNRDTTEYFRNGVFQYGMPILVIAEALYENDAIVQELTNSYRLADAETVFFRDPFILGNDTDSSLYYVIYATKNTYVPGKKYLILCNWELSKTRYRKFSNEKIRIVEGHISLASQIKLMSDTLFNKFETYD